MFVGCPQVHDLWVAGYAADLWLLGGGLLVGLLGGIGAGVRCVTHWGSPRARAIESAAMLAFCTPVCVVGLGLLLLFSPAFGVWHVPYFFDHTKLALAQATPPTIDVPTLQALALWVAALIVVMSAIADIALVKLDPRLRANGRVPG
jgi:ABC-type dipeptide/oligopeptide/nickel transport system permease component